MIHLKRTNSNDKDFQFLVAELDKDLAIRNGDTNDFFVQFNKIDTIKYAMVAYNNLQPAGCGAMKEYDPLSMEIKRMYVPVELRGHGVAVLILQDLEKWAIELGYHKCILETGAMMPEAIALYKKCGYSPIPNYGQYENVKSSICFSKLLKL